MAKTPRTGENRGRRASDRRRTEQPEAAAPEATPSTADDRATVAAALSAERRNGPTREQIARRAYEIYLTRGGTHGYDIEDWLQAERELRETRSRRAV